MPVPTVASMSCHVAATRPGFSLPSTTTDVLTVWTPPVDAVADTVIRYVPSATVVGSNVASVAGGAPVPLPIVAGVPPSVFATVTFHDVIDAPVGGWIDAVTGVGAVTREPSAGPGETIAGGAPAGAVGVGDGAGDVVVGEGVGDVAVGEGVGDVVVGVGVGEVVVGEGVGDVAVGEGVGLLLVGVGVGDVVVGTGVGDVVVGDGVPVSLGDGDGGGVYGGTVHTTSTVLDSARIPVTNVVACSWSVPSCQPT